MADTYNSSDTYDDNHGGSPFNPTAACVDPDLKWQCAGCSGYEVAPDVCLFWESCAGVGVLSHPRSKDGRKV